MSRCQLQYLDPGRRGRWVDCARPAPVALAVNGVHRNVCSEHREEVRRLERAGLATGLRWSEDPTRPRRQPDGDQGQLLDTPARQRPRRWSR
jgi:hypothetical protein